ncbi:unnamed protein product [Trichogramma brassicae]|uniref:Uncharacterized protein n=1 Tax=Trichogramma brassicae TaxID=86971 RepID=A0A6H5HYZ0_9HYME|nr:unnamed protein product [Trichogramma brassicae]
MVRTGYKDEPKIDRNGKSIVRRTTPLHHLARSDYSPSLCKELFEIYHRFAVNYVDDTGLTHFHVACMYDEAEIIEQFLLNGHDPNRVVPQTGDSPLHLALVYNSCLAVYENLLYHGADPSLANKAGWTPLNIISDNDMMEIFVQLKVLFRPPLLVNKKGKLGRSPLELAVRKGMPDVVNVLTEKGIDVSSFVFPAREDFSEFIQKCRECWDSGKVSLASGLLSIVESLENKGYGFNRSTSMMIMNLFAEQELFENSSNDEESWYNDEGFTEEAKKMKICGDLSLYDLTRLQPKEAYKKLNYMDYYNFVSPENVEQLPETHRIACLEHLSVRSSKFAQCTVSQRPVKSLCVCKLDDSTVFFSDASRECYQFEEVSVAAICCVGCMYEKLGRMMGRSYEETVQILIKSLRSAESQTRIEIMHTLEKVCAGMGSAVTNVHRDIYKVCRHCLTDRVMAVRCAAAKAYVVFVQMLGSTWLERNIGTWVAHVLDLVANPKAASSHVDAVYSRKCINFILRGTIGKLLGEGAQAAACKEIAHVILKQMNSIDFSPENAKDFNQETLFSQHLLVCALQEMGNLILGLGTTASNLLNDQSLNLIETTTAVLVHPCQAARLAAAWCLRCICVAVPSQITPLIDACVEHMEKLRTSPEAITGYSSALAAVLGSVRFSPLGVPHTKGKIIFNTAEELLRSASQNSRLSLNRTHAGWLLIGAIMTLGTAVVKGLLPRMLLLWRNSFPRSNKELESEKARGDAFTWQVTLEGRSGALSAMHSFLLHCPELVNEDITRRLLTPIESALAMLTNAAGSGALEHNSCCLYRPIPAVSYRRNDYPASVSGRFSYETFQDESLPGPLPLGVAVIDMSASLFGQIFPRVANKHRLQMLDHFNECIKHAKSARQEAIQMNVFTAVLSGFKGLSETKTSFGQDDVKKSATNLIIRTLSSNHLLLRKAAISCLRQLAQREAKEVCEHAMTLANESRDTNVVEGLVITETGLPGVLFSMLDTETDRQLIKEIHDTLTSMLQILVASNLSPWLSLCKDVLTIATESSLLDDAVNATAEEQVVDNENVDAEGDDDQAEFHADESTKQRQTVSPRWPTRVFAAQCVRRIITACANDKQAHFDLTLAKEMQNSKGKGDYLVSHLSDLVRMAFMAATSDCDPLRLEGLKTLQEIIDKFAKVPEPEFPGHLLLEQFQAQVGAALRPAFASDTSPHVTAAACEACSAWIGSGVARDLNDLRRVHQLLVSSLEKLRNGHSRPQLYNESLSTLERLAILKAWAEVYIVAMINDGSTLNNRELINRHNQQINEDSKEDFGDFEFQNESLLSLVQPELPSLSQHWLAALRDHALLSLPPEFSSQLPHDGGAFYTTDTMESARPYYANSWAPILYAATLWLNVKGFELNETTGSNTKSVDGTNNNQAVKTGSNKERFYLLFGICMEALCSTRSSESLQNIETCLKALYTLLDSAWARKVLMSNKSLPIELCNVLHRLLLTKEVYSVQIMVMEILKQVVKANQEDLSKKKRAKSKELATDEDDGADIPELDLLGEGEESGELLPGKSLVFAIMEVCFCLLVRQIPPLNPTPGAATAILSQRGYTATVESGKLIATALSVMEALPGLCSPAGSVAILPTLLYLTTGVMRETAIRSSNSVIKTGADTTIHAALHCLKNLAVNKYSRDPRSQDQWTTFVQSALAKVIDLAKAGNDETKMDEVAMMLGIAVFVLHALPEVVSAPNLLFPCINHFRQTIQSDNIYVRF